MPGFAPFTWLLCVSRMCVMCAHAAHSSPRITSLAMAWVAMNGMLVAPADPVAALSSLSTQGGEVVRINGENLGPALPRAYVTDAWYGSGGVRYTFVNCTFTIPHSQLECVTVPGSGFGHHVQLSILGQAASLSNVLAYGSPGIVSSTPATVPTTGASVTITGVSFGGLAASIQVLVNGRATASSLLVSGSGLFGAHPFLSRHFFVAAKRFSPPTCTIAFCVVALHPMTRSRTLPCNSS
jgi:hypothetical protein